MTTPPYQGDDYAASIDTYGAVAVGKPARGSFEYGFFYYIDSDWFRVKLTAGETYVFAMSNIAISTFNHTELALRDATGQQLTVRAGNGANGATFEYTAATSGTYFVDARTVASYIMGSQNAYQVSVDRKPAGDDFAASTATSGAGVLGAATSAVHETAGDSDWFAYTFEAGKTYSLAPAAGNAGPVDLAVFNGSGEVVAAPGSAFTPAAGGKYFVAATAYKAGSYSFTVAQATDDHGSDATSTSRLALGSAVSATLNHIGDKDWFKVSLAANTFYTFELDLAQPGAGEAIKLLLMKPDGTAVTDYDRTTNAEGKAVMMVRVDTAGDYFANVSYGAYVGGEASEKYTLKWSATAVVDEAGDTELAARSAAVGTPVSGELTGSRDVDVYKFTLAKGVTYSFNVSGADAARMSAELRDPHGIYWRSTHDGAAIVITPEFDGAYTITLAPRGEEFQRLQYTLNSSRPVDDYAANVAGAGSLAVGASVKGSILEGGGDRDWIGVEMTAGTTYWLTLSSDGATNTYSSALGRIVDANGTVLASTPYYLPTYPAFDLPTLALTPAVSGTYYYEVSGYSGVSGNYKLTAAVGTPDDAGDRITEAAKLSDNVVKAGILEVATDIDVYQVSPNSSAPYAILIERGDYGYSYGSDTRFYNSAAQDIYPSSVVQSGTNKIFIFEAGTYISYVSVGALSTQNGATYKIKGFNFTDDYAGSAQSTGAVAVNGSTSGAIEVAGDRDFLKVRLEAGVKYVIDLYGAAGGGTIAATDPNVLTLIDPSGFGVTTSTVRAGGEARIEVVAQATGDYFVAVGNQSNNSLVTGAYRVAVTQLSGDVTAPTLTTGAAAAATTVANLQLGFSEQMQVDASAFTIKDSAGQPVLAHTQLSVSVAHNTVTIDPSLFLQPGRTYTLEVAPGGLRDLAGNLYTGQNSWTFATPAPSAGPTSGNDMLVSAGKGSFVDGGAGVDTLVMPGVRGDYLIFRFDDGRVQLQPMNGAASEVLSNVERVFFSDQALAFDADGAGGQAYRLYRAAFDRLPDSIGVGFWTGQLDKGMPAKAVADAFLSSTEFIGRHGSMLSNAEFVNLLYRNVLHRPGDDEGVAYWTKLLDQGYSRAETLVGFADSPENQDYVTALIGTGFVYTPI